MKSFDNMNREDAIAYCEAHRREYLVSLLEAGDNDAYDAYECLLSCVSTGEILPCQLPEYGMDFED